MGKTGSLNTATNNEAIVHGQREGERVKGEWYVGAVVGRDREKRTCARESRF